jgi:arylsulfatase A-like enzyme
MRNTLLIAVVAALLANTARAEKPNFVVVVADDLGWRDMGYSGSPHAKTPQLDEMARSGVRFDYFYAAQQMCSPGRFAILTGRTPLRTGLHHLGAMRAEEITIAKALKAKDYATGHFGKWHLGGGATSPAKMGFDKAIWKINYYDLGASLQVGDTKEQVPLAGDTSVATMRIALDFIAEAAAAKQPFFVQVCFGSPHSPHQATDEFRAIYKDLPEKQQHFYGEISGIDAAVGELRSKLRELAIADNTLIWFVSDNGGITKLSQDPAGKGKGSVGVRTAGVLEWPAGVAKPIATNIPCAHMDIYPTLLELAGVTVPDQPPLDGVSLAPLLAGKMEERDKPLGFMLWNGRSFAKADFVADTTAVWIDPPYKLVVAPQRADEPADGAAKPKKKDQRQDIGAPDRLYQIYDDPAERNNLAESKPEIVARWRADLQAWQRSVRASFDGGDFAKK